jgi:predicted ribosome quality control (RQC) complex YloA/Tae2 family protein
MSLSALEIGFVTKILDTELRGASVREVISERDSGHLTFILRSNGVNHYLRVVLNPGETRIGRIKVKPKAAPVPHPFVMLLRRETVGLGVMNISWINQDRVVRLAFGRGERMCAVVAELTSRHANLFWLNAKGEIGGSFFPNRSHQRDLNPGNPYIHPSPPRSAVSPSNRFRNAAVPEAAIDAYYSEKTRDREAEAQRTRLLRMIRTASRKASRLLKKLETDLERAENGDRLFNQGHVLKAHLSQVKKGMSQMETVDFEGNPISIDLNPTLSPTENMEKIFTRAKRYGRAIGQIEDRMLLTMTDIDRLRNIETAVQEANPPRLNEIETGLLAQYPYLKKISGQGKNVQEERLPYREFIVSNNRTVRVGRSAKDNDMLTLRHAKPQDLWLHVRGDTGSHVVVPMGRKEVAQQDLLVDAAHLAAHFSRLKGESDVEVIYTRRRYVQKPKGAAPGSVRLIQEKTINLRIEQARLDRILKGQ